MQRVLAAVIAILFTLGGISAYRMGTDAGLPAAGDGRVDADGRRPTTGDPALDGKPGPGQVRVHGTVRELEAATAAIEALAFPLTLEAAERGAGRARIEPATVGGKPGAAILWDSGRPLPVTGPGALDPAGPVRVAAADGSLRVHLDGAARAFPPGTFSLGATVAVGRAGLAQPRDRVSFGTDGTTLQTSGDVYVALGGPLRFEGPTPLTVRGDLTMEHHDGEVVDVSGLDFAGGPLIVELTPVEGGWRIEALLQGAVVAVS